VGKGQEGLGGYSVNDRKPFCFENRIINSMQYI